MRQNELTDTRKGYVEWILFAVAVVWGANPPVVKVGLQYLSPMPYNFARMVVATIVAMLALWLSGTYRKFEQEDLRKVLQVSAFGFLVFQVCFAEGVLRTTAGNASFLLCLLPVSVVLINKFFGLEALTRPAMVGIGLSMAGVAFIVLGSGKEISLASTHLVGTGLMLLAQFGYAYYTVFSRPLLQKYSTYQITAALMLMTTLLMFPFSAGSVLTINWAGLPLNAWGSVVFSSVLALCLGNFLWIWGAGIIGSTRASVFNNLSPVFAVIFGYLLLNESFGPLQFAGAIAVFAGVWITRHRKLPFSRRI